MPENYTAMPLSFDFSTENSIADSIMNDKSLSIEQRRMLLEERMANLPPEQREKLEEQKRMNNLGYLFLGINPALASRIPQAQWGEIGAKIAKNSSSITLPKNILRWLGEGAGAGALETRNNLIQEGVKKGIMQAGEGIKETIKEIPNIPKNTKLIKEELEYETGELLRPKIPYIDY
jgi:hypothetical protein